ncbi:TPA: hypothetical protein ACXYK5_003309 [Legionella pneumophila]
MAESNFDEMVMKIINSGCYVFKKNSSPGKSLYFTDPDGHKLEIHIGNSETRIRAKKSNLGNWKNVQWFI